MTVSLQLTKKFSGPKLRAKDCPQDGARLITLLENATWREIGKAAHFITKDYLESEGLIRDIKRCVVMHLFHHGITPKYFCSRWLVTHDLKVHEKNMDYLKHIFDDRPEILSINK